MTGVNKKYLGLCFIGLIFGVILIAVSCQKRGALPTLSAVSISGLASAAPIENATIREYSLNSDGSLGDLISVTTTDSNGIYLLPQGASATPVAIVLTKGTYAEEVGGRKIALSSAEQLRVFLPSVSEGQDIGITPFTELAAARVLDLLGAGATDLAGTISSANDLMAVATGLTSITTSPDNIYQPISNPNSNAGIYALLLAGLSQFASTHSLASSLVALSAFSSDFHRDGYFNGSDNGSRVAFGGGAGSLATNGWSTGLHAAVLAYASSSQGAASGFSAAQVPTLIDNPSAPNACPSGTSACGSNCVDLTSDDNNCGICGTALHR